MATHTDATRPEYGYELPRYGEGSMFDRARDANTRAGWKVEHAGEQIADAVVGDYLDYIVRDGAPERYQKAKAALTYARAVFEVEVAKVRAA